MLFSQAHGRKVVSTTTADTVGRIDGFIVDPAIRAILALQVKKASTGSVLLWADMTAFGSDAVTVPGAEHITEPAGAVAELSGKGHQLLGKRVLTTLGDEIGKVDDVEFDADNGTITGLMLKQGQIDGIRLIGVGSYAVVVQAE
jgi:sporulation protein YlmC with PRC-barrel domain